MKKNVILILTAAILIITIVFIVHENRRDQLHMTADDRENLLYAPSPSGNVDRYEVITAKINSSILGAKGNSNEEESCVIRLDKFTGRAWYFEMSTLIKKDGNAEIIEQWTPIKY